DASCMSNRVKNQRTHGGGGSKDHDELAANSRRLGEKQPDSAGADVKAFDLHSLSDGDAVVRQQTNVTLAGSASLASLLRASDSSRCHFGFHARFIAFLHNTHLLRAGGKLAHRSSLCIGKSSL